MGDIEKAWLTSPSRRKALIRMAGLMAASPLGAAMAQPDPTRPLSQVRRILSLAEMQTAFDFEPVFQGNVTRFVYETTAHGDGSEFNLRRNRQSFDWVDIVSSRPAVPASQVDLSSELFGVKMRFPILVAPSGGQAALHPEGDLGMSRAATAAGMVDIRPSPNLDWLKANMPTFPGGNLWAQHYPIENLANMQTSLENIQSTGVQCIAVTVDQQASVYERTLVTRHLGGVANGGNVGFGGNTAALAAAAAAAAAAAGGPPVHGSVRYRVSDRRLWYTWDYIDAVRKVVKGKLLIKGIQHPDDARLAINHGADGIIVSNHGGRSMDYGPSTLEILPQIAAAVNGRVPVLIDSGFRRGSDVFKALALGADGICLGRAARWGLGAFGSAGAQRVFEIIQQELLQTAAAAGCATLSDIDPSTVRTNFV